jgi:uncharacterized repeat protein (TIGR01451 family)
MDSGVACGAVKLTWDDSSTPGAYYSIYRSTSPGGNATVVANQPETTYIDNSASSGVTYYYVIRAYVNNPDGTFIRSGPQEFSPYGIQTSSCNANFSLSNKIIYAVNGKPYHFTSSCRVPSQVGTFTGTIKKGDKVTFAINVCNTGSLNATSVSVRDDLANSNLTLHNPSGIVMSQGTATVTGNIVTFDFGNIAAGSNAQVRFDADVTPPAGNTQNLLRFRNLGQLTFSTAQSADNNYCTGTGTNLGHACALDTGFVVFYNGLKAPSEQEVTP